MKKLFLFSVLFCFLAINFVKVYSCDSPYINSKSVIFSYPTFVPPSPCNGTIYYCWYIDGQGVLQEKIDRIEMNITCAQYVIFDQAFYDAVNQDMINDVVNLGDQLPPCQGQPPLQLQDDQCICNKIQNDPVHFIMRVLPCYEYAICRSVYQVCWNPGTSTVYKLLLRRFAIGDDCNAGYPVLPPQGLTFQQPWITSCYTGVTCIPFP